MALAASLYLATAARDIVVGDAPELITAAVTLGVAHPPGYPLFTMLGHLFTLLPVGPIPFRVNLLSVTCDVLTVGIIYLTALRLSGSRLAAAMAALILAIRPVFWAWSLVAEVFSLNNLLASLLIYLLVLWYERPERTKLLVAASFVAGLALTNHQTFVLLGPACCFLFWRHRIFLWQRPHIIAICVLALLIGLLPYAYVPWAAARHPLLNWGRVSSVQDLMAMMTRKNFGTFRLVSTPGYSGGSMPDRVIVLIISFGLVMALSCFIGLINSFRNLRWYFWFSLVAFVFVGPFFVAITNLNLAAHPSALFVLQRFFLLSYVVVAPSAALGLLAIARGVAPYLGPVRAASLPVVAAATAMALLIGVVRHYRALDQSHNHIARLFGEDVFSTLEPRTILLAYGDAIMLPLTYLNVVDRTRPDVALILLPLLTPDWYLKQLHETYPDLTIPFDHYDGSSRNLKMLVEANAGRRIALIGGMPTSDKSLNSDYQFYPLGLVKIVVPKSEPFDISELVKANEELLQRYRPPPIDAIKMNGFERDILNFYAASPCELGAYFEHTGEKRDAGIWYARALGLDPSLARAREGLARVSE